MVGRAQAPFDAGWGTDNLPFVSFVCFDGKQ
jgi:hypothetical protein